MILAAGAAGYVLGAKARRNRYDQIAEQARKLRSNPTVQQKVSEARHVAKGALAAGAGLATGQRGVGVACGLAAVLGHVYPATRQLRGGKGVATGAGMALVLLPGVTVVLGVVWVVVVKVFGAASAGSVAVAIGLPAGAWLVGRPTAEVAAFAVCGVLVVIRHRDNLDRLRRGEERSLTKEDSG